MQTIKQEYNQILYNTCNEIHLDYYPQVEASELLYRIITLEDIYLPLNIGDALFASGETLDKNAETEYYEKEIVGKPITENRLAHQNTSVGKSELPITGLRLLLSGLPGGGKSTFCKRLVLAIIKNDSSFLEKYLTENGLSFKTQSTPFLVDCKNIADLTTEFIRGNSIQDIIYRLYALALGSHFLSISRESFVRMFLDATKHGMTLVVDGWDEMLDQEKGELFRNKLDDFLCEHPLIDLVVTIREKYDPPIFVQKYSKRYCIQPLSDDDIREFCKKWCEVILGTQTHHQNNPMQIADQILKSNSSQIKHMRTNPLDLSLLLTVSKNDGRLPENKSDLFKEVIELYIFWSTHKNTGALSAKSIRVLLSYIACSFTKHDKLVCSRDELIRIIKQCIVDLEWSFSEDMLQIDVTEIIRELSHTGILISNSSGSRYSFSDSRHGAHRQMQEYLTAYAILVGYADEEYNNKIPVDIFEDKYDNRHWREVVLFLVLMNNGRVRQEIINRMIHLAENEKDNSHYTNLLFEAVVNGADIRLADKHKIYDIVFAKQITDTQLSDIFALLQNDTNKTARDFIDYISISFTDSVNRNDELPLFSFAKATIEATLAIKDGINPFTYAQNLLSLERSRADIMIGANIVSILAWCKYAKIHNEFSPYCTISDNIKLAQILQSLSSGCFAAASDLFYKIPPEMICAMKELLTNNICRTELLECIRDSIIADFATFESFFQIGELEEYYKDISFGENLRDAEIVLSLAPIFTADLQAYNNCKDDVREKYLDKFQENKSNEDYDSLIFTFCVCVALGCWAGAELLDNWSLMQQIYSDSKQKSDIGKVRFSQLEKQKESAPFWTLIEKAKNIFVYEAGIKKMIIHRNDLPFSQIASDFLLAELPNNYMTNNNLAYLLRRRELSKIEWIEFNTSTEISPSHLLTGGAVQYDKFSIVNMALLKSGTYVNTVGDPKLGKIYLFTQVQNSLFGRLAVGWSAVINWWLKLACVHREFEGLIVLQWLFDLKVFDPKEYDNKTLSALISFFSEPLNAVEGMCDFIAALKYTLSLRQ